MTDEIATEDKKGKGRRSGSVKKDPVSLSEMPDVLDLKQLAKILGKSYQSIVKTEHSDLPPHLPIPGHRKYSKPVVRAWLDKNGNLTEEDLQKLTAETDSGSD